MNVNRLSGLFITLFSCLLFLWLIPSQTEYVDYGWLKPDSMPKIATTILLITGLYQIVFPRGKTEFTPRAFAKTSLFFVVGFAALIGIKFFGFLAVCPLFVLVLMLMSGERRWQWLLAGVVILPGSIFFCIEVLLNRPLP